MIRQHTFSIALVSACAFACAPGPAATPEAKAAVDKVAAIAIRVGEVSEGQIPQLIVISGSLVAAEDSAIAAEVEGKVVKVEVDLGDRVKKDQILAQIDPDEYRLRLAQAEALAQQAQDNLGRAEKLAKTELVAAQALDDARAAAAQTRATADLANKKFQGAQVRSPFAGAVSKRTVSSGEYVRTGQQLFQIVQLDPLKLTAEVPERYIAQVHTGDAVKAEVEAYKGQPFLGTIKRISPAINPGSRAFTIEAMIPNQDGRAHPGLFARAEINVGLNEHALLVPEAALSSYAGVTRVFRIEGKTAHEVKVEVEQRLPNGLAVVSGELKLGDKVAVEGLARVADGSEVELK